MDIVYGKGDALMVIGNGFAPVSHDLYPFLPVLGYDCAIVARYDYKYYTALPQPVTAVRDELSSASMRHDIPRGIYVITPVRLYNKKLYWQWLMTGFFKNNLVINRQVFKLPFKITPPRFFPLPERLLIITDRVLLYNTRSKRLSIMTHAKLKGMLSRAGINASEFLHSQLEQVNFHHLLYTARLGSKNVHYVISVYGVERKETRPNEEYVLLDETPATVTKTPHECIVSINDKKIKVKGCLYWKGTSSITVAQPSPDKNKTYYVIIDREGNVSRMLHVNVEILSVP